MGVPLRAICAFNDFNLYIGLTLVDRGVRLTEYYCELHLSQLLAMRSLQSLSFSKTLLQHASFVATCFLSLIPGQGDGSPPRSSPGSSTGVSDRSDSGGWSTTPAEPGHAPGSVGPDVLSLHQLHYSVDRWRSPVVQYGADRPPATE